MVVLAVLALAGLAAATMLPRGAEPPRIAPDLTAPAAKAHV